MSVFFLVLLVYSSSSLNQDWCKQDPEYDYLIEKNFQPFNEGITPQMLDDNYVKSFFPASCKIVWKNNLITIQKGYEQITRSLKQMIRRSVKGLPDFHFYFNIRDEAYALKNKCPKQGKWNHCGCDKGYQQPDHGAFFKNMTGQTSAKIPIFSSTSVFECFFDIIIPSFFHSDMVFKDKFYFQQKVPKWQERQFKAIWRGSNTGYWGYITDEPSLKHHRYRLVQLCKTIKDCDAAFTQIRQNPERDIQLLKYGQAEVMPMSEQAKYKVIIDIDGNTFSARFPQALIMGAVFKIFVYRDIGNMMAKPWQHYVPIKFDLSDFEQKLQWARNNDEELKQIYLRGKQFSLNRLKIENYVCYTKNLFIKYLSLVEKGRKISQENYTN